MPILISNILISKLYASTEDCIKKTLSNSLEAIDQQAVNINQIIISKIDNYLPVAGSFSKVGAGESGAEIGFLKDIKLAKKLVKKLHGKNSKFLKYLKD